jgi:hypothetical protein
MPNIIHMRVGDLIFLRITALSSGYTVASVCPPT